MAAFDKNSDYFNESFFEDVKNHGTPTCDFVLNDTKAGLWRKKARKAASSFAKGLGLLILACSIAWMVTQNRKILKNKEPHQSISIRPGHSTKPWPHRCHVESCRSFEVEFPELQQFEFSEAFQSGPAASGQFHGYIQLLPAPDGQVADLKLNILVHASSQFLTENVEYKKSESAFSVTLPRPWSQPGEKHNHPCLLFNASLYFRPGLELDNLLFSTMASHVNIASGFNVTVANATTLNLGVSYLYSESFPTSRKTYINIDVGTVRGKYPLYDLLSIQAQLASVEIDVLPKAIDKAASAAAKFLAHSKAGNFNVTYPPAGVDIPDRDYHTHIFVEEGAFTGRYLHGRNTSLLSGAGEIDVEILPYTADKYNSTLLTSSLAGRQNLRLLSPHLWPGRNIEKLWSVHGVGTGGLELQYPPEWKGAIEGKTIVGPIELTGEDVKVISKGSVGLVGQYIVALRGNGSNKMEFVSNVGGANITMN